MNTINTIQTINITNTITSDSDELLKDSKIISDYSKSFKENK